MRRLSTEPQSGCAMLLYLFVIVFVAIYNNDDNRDTNDNNNNNNNNKKQDLTIHRSAVSRTSAHLQWEQNLKKKIPLKSSLLKTLIGAKFLSQFVSHILDNFYILFMKIELLFPSTIVNNIVLHISTTSWRRTSCVQVSGNFKRICNLCNICEVCICVSNWRRFVS